MSQKFLKPDAVRAFLKEVPESQLFTVEFEKEDGTLRKMAARRGVVAHLKGGESTIKDKPNLVGVFDMNKGYRCFDDRRVISLKSGDVVVKP